MRLTFEQGRVLATMIEKAMTTPAGYPISLNGVTIACNQVSNREPVSEFTEAHVELVLRGLADDGLARMVHRPGDRVVKYRHALDEQLQTSAQETALLAVLMLRGAQTPGELRQRTIRYVEFVSLPELEQVLAELERRQLAQRLARQPGQKESRYVETLTQPQPDSEPAHADEAIDEGSEAAPEIKPSTGLRGEFDDLKRRFEELLSRLGETVD